MEQAKKELKECVARYRELDNQIREVNKSASTLREKRKITEMEISDYLKIPEFSQHNLISLDDGSKIKIQRPQQWSKSWSISKGDLGRYLKDYFENHGDSNAVDCFTYISKRQKEDAVSNEFKLTRFISDENVDNE
jgi:hypothetical protein